MGAEMKEFLSLLFQRADATQIFWNIYTGVVTLVLGVVTAGKSEWLNRWVCIALTVAFLFFALANYLAIDSMREQREELAQVMKKMDGYERVEAVVNSASPPSKPGLIIFHGVLDLAVVVFIWGIPYARRALAPPLRRGTQGSENLQKAITVNHIDSERSEVDSGEHA